MLHSKAMPLLGLGLFLVSLSLTSMDTAAVEIKRIDIKTPNELFYENVTINGHIGSSLVVTNQSGDIEIINTSDGLVSATFELSDQQRVSNVISSPGSTVGMITIERAVDSKKYYRHFVFVEGLKTLHEGNSYKAGIEGLYPATEQGAADRERDYISIISTNKTGDLLARSDVTGKSILIDRAYEGMITAVNNGEELKSTYLAGPTSVFSNNHRSPLMCFNDNGTHFVQAFKLDNGNVEKFVIKHKNDDQFSSVKVFDLPLAAQAVSVQCFGGADNSFYMTIEANLTNNVDLHDIPTRNIIASSNTIETVKTTKVNTNTIRILHDGTSEVRSAGGFFYHPETRNLINTPVAHGVYIELSHRKDKSILSTFDHSLGIKLPGFPVSLIEYPTNSKDERHYCVFDQNQKSIYKTCYKASL